MPVSLLNVSRDFYKNAYRAQRCHFSQNMSAAYTIVTIPWIYSLEPTKLGISTDEYKSFATHEVCVNDSLQSLELRCKLCEAMLQVSATTLENQQHCYPLSHHAFQSCSLPPLPSLLYLYLLETSHQLLLLLGFDLAWHIILLRHRSSCATFCCHDLHAVRLGWPSLHRPKCSVALTKLLTCIYYPLKWCEPHSVGPCIPSRHAHYHRVRKYVVATVLKQHVHKSHG